MRSCKTLPVSFPWFSSSPLQRIVSEWNSSPNVWFINSPLTLSSKRVIIIRRRSRQNQRMEAKGKKKVYQRCQLLLVVLPFFLFSSPFHCCCYLFLIPIPRLNESHTHCLCICCCCYSISLITISPSGSLLFVMSVSWIHSTPREEGSFIQLMMVRENKRGFFSKPSSSLSLLILTMKSFIPFYLDWVSKLSFHSLFTSYSFSDEGRKKSRHTYSRGKFTANITSLNGHYRLTNDRKSQLESEEDKNNRETIRGEQWVEGDM